MGGQDYAGSEGDPGVLTILVLGELPWKSVFGVPYQVEPSIPNPQASPWGPGSRKPPLGFSIETDWHLGTTTDGPLRFLQRWTWLPGRSSLTTVPQGMGKVPVVAGFRGGSILLGARERRPLADPIR